MTRIRRKAPSLSAIADRVGVHVTTVSLALRGSSKIPESTAERIRKAATEMGYVPNRAARALRGAPTQTIGVVVPNVVVPYYAQWVDLLFRTSQNHGYEIELRFHEWREESEIKAVQQLVSHRVDAIFLIGAVHHSLKNISPFFQQPDAPLLVYHNSPCKGADLKCFGENKLKIVIPDMSVGYQKCLSYLYEQGHRDIALLFPSPYFDSNLKEMQELIASYPGFRARVFQEQASDALQSEIQTSGQSGLAAIKRTKALAREFFKAPLTEKVVFTTDEVHALAVCEEASLRGYKIPDDLSIITTGGSFLCELGPIHLSHIQYPSPAAAEEVYKLLTDASSPSLYNLLPVGFNVGRSVRSTLIKAG